MYAVQSLNPGKRKFQRNHQKCKNYTESQLCLELGHIYRENSYLD